MAAPLPIASLIRRVRSAKSAKERHDLAYFAWEASIRLVVAVRPPANVAELQMPSVGHWVAAAQFGDERFEQMAILAAYARLTEVGQDKASTVRSVTAKKLFDAVPAYRNHVLGHGAVRSGEFYETSGNALADGIEALWEAGAFWPAAHSLVYVEAVELDPRGERKARVMVLDGALSAVDNPRGTVVPAHVLPKRLYLRDGDSYRTLHPFVLFEEAELRERVLFFNSRRRTSEYLDYVSGERVRGKALAAFAALEDELAAAFAGEVAASDDEAEPRDASRFGDYQLLGKLGEGGMGVVYLAKHVMFDRLVALKMLPPSASDNPTTVARFKREIAALARCDHPNVIRILASGFEDDRHYYTMELVEGTDLAGLHRALSSTEDFDRAITTASERVRQAKADVHGSLPVLAVALRPATTHPTDQLRKLVELFHEAALGVEHLHEKGILHRDLKPANLMVTAVDHRVVVMDLGLATIGDASESLTRDKSTLLGTLRYMPPEQLQRNFLELDRRTDVYALGATFYELLTGKPIFDGDTEVRLIEQVLRETPRPPRQVNPRLPRDLATILGKAIEKDPKQRYDTAGALAADLDAYLAGRPISARPATLGYLLGLAIRKHRAIAATVALGVVLAIGGLWLFLARERELRRDAEVARALAERRGNEAKQQRLEAIENANQGLLVQARNALEVDPAETLAFLAQLSPDGGGWDLARIVAADALSRPPASTIVHDVPKRGSESINQVFFDHPGPLVLERGGKYGSIEGSDGTIVVELATGRTSRFASATLDGGAFCDDGKRFVGRGDGPDRVVEVDLASGTTRSYDAGPHGHERERARCTKHARVIWRDDKPVRWDVARDDFVPLGIPADEAWLTVDGDHLLTVHKHVLARWAMPDLRPLGSVPLPARVEDNEPVEPRSKGLVFSDNGQIAAVAGPVAYRFDLDRQRVEQRDRCDWVAVAADGNQIAFGYRSGEFELLVDVDTRCRFTDVTSVDALPRDDRGTGRTIVTDTIVELVQTWTPHGLDKSSPPQFSPDNRYLLRDQQICDLQQNTRATLRARGHQIAHIAGWTRDGSPITVGADLTLRIWHPFADVRYTPIDPARRARFSPDARTLITASATAIRRVDATGKTLEHHAVDGLPDMLAVADSGRAAWATGTRVHAWTPGQPPKLLGNHDTTSRLRIAIGEAGIPISWNGSSLVVWRDPPRTHAILPPGTKQPDDAFTIDRTAAYAGIATPDGTYLVELATGTQTRLADAVSPIAFATDGTTFVTTTASKTLQIWKSGAVTPLRTIEIGVTGTPHVARDNKHVAVIAATTGAVVDLETGAIRRVRPKLGTRSADVQLDGDARRLLLGEPQFPWILKSVRGHEERLIRDPRTREILAARLFDDRVVLVTPSHVVAIADDLPVEPIALSAAIRQLGYQFTGDTVHLETRQLVRKP